MTPEFHDYYHFVSAAYLIAALILAGFAAISLIKFYQNHRQLLKLEKNAHLKKR